MRRLLCVAGVCVVVSGLAGCVSPTAFKPMLQDSEGYSSRYFNLAMLAPEARNKLPAAGAEPLGFKRLLIKGSIEISSTSLPNFHRHIVFEQTLINDHDDGMVRGFERRSVNDLPVLLRYWSSYHEIVSLSWQNGVPSLSRTLPITSVRSVSAWKSVATMQPDTDYDFVMDYGYIGPLAPSFKAERHCKSASFYDASKFLPGLPGQAIDLDCDNVNSSGAKTLRFQMVWLTQYGIALDKTLTSVGGISSFKYDSVVSEPAP